MSSSPYAKDIQNILASLNQPDDEPQSLPDEEPTNTLYVYKTEQGGILLSPTRIEGDEEDPQPETIIDSQDEPQPAKREPPHFLYFILILCLFVVLDVANNQLIAFMAPTVNVTLQPTVKTITLHSTEQLGKVLSPITLTESQTVTTTGHGHQDTRAATGSLAFYNTAFTSQTVDAGTVITGADGVKIVTSSCAIYQRSGYARLPNSDKGRPRHRSPASQSNRQYERCITRATHARTRATNHALYSYYHG